MRTNTTTATISLAAAAVMLLAACSNKAADSGSGGDGDLKTDYGVTADEITLGVLTDTSGVFKAVGLNLTQGDQLWADKVNEAGGICGRDIKLALQDHGYKADNAVSLYEQGKQDIVGYVQLLGSPIVAALKSKVVSDEMLAVIGTNSSVLLDNDYLMMPGTGYDLEMINGLAWASEQGMLADGDKIGHVYIDSEYGQNGLLGSKHYAKQHGIEVVEVPVGAADTDMTATITKLKNDGVKLIALSLAPAGAASAALQNQVQGLNVPIIGNNPNFATALLSDASVVSAMENFHIAQGYETYSGESELSKEIQASFDERYPDEEPGYGIPPGYLGGLMWEAILNEACDNGDMTREGLLEARLSLDSVDAQGLSADMDLSNPGVPATRSVYIVKIDPDAPGGESIVEGPYVTDEAKEYETPYQQ
ncbi:ABC transporter substrate-binding protein [Blastococcus sp. Marseille-P5729]|uniref:ABC transporter substrate-binding protein n=1 Tax=Blastococcus sp. Marseille-P5729 TaxID=2086582 RepID=UPI00131EB93D|nr:ABC transporter substrate-binding protein [Blastococcus sp. Marseille-P5729]